MTNASRYFAAAPRRHRERLGRYGVAGSLMLWALTLGFVPLYVLVALAAGSACFLADAVRARLGAPGGIGRAMGGERTPTSSASAGHCGEALEVIDLAGFPILRDQADRLVITLPRTSAFEVGGATPSIGARRFLERLSSAIEAGTWRIDVIGYDDGPGHDAGAEPRTAAAALSLAARRAKAVVRALEEAGCRQPIAALGAPLSRLWQRRSESSAEPAGEADVEAAATGVEIVLRHARHGSRHAA